VNRYGKPKLKTAREKTPTVPRMAQVEWLDACAYMGDYGSENGVVPGDPSAVGIVHTSVGWMVRDDKSGIILAITQVIGSDGLPNAHRMCVEIPRAYVRKVRILK
jgi:hypothetical protein